MYIVCIKYMTDCSL